MKNLSLSVAVLYRNGKFDNLYDCVPSYEDADALAQYEMGRKPWGDLIVIFPGYNRSIHSDSIEYANVQRLADLYRAERRKK